MSLGLDKIPGQTDRTEFLPLFPDLARSVIKAGLSLRLVVDNSIQRCDTTRQLELDLFGTGSVEWLVTRPIVEALDYRVLTVFGSSGITRKAALRLEHRGVERVGDLVACPRQVVLAALGRNELALAAIERQLREFGLELGIAIPSWSGGDGRCKLDFGGERRRA